MLLEGLFGGGNSSSPPSNTENQPTTSPQIPKPATSETTPVDEPAHDDMPVGGEDDTYSSMPTDDDADDEAATPEPVPSTANDGGAASPALNPATIPAPTTQPAGSADDILVSEASAFTLKGDPVARITNLIAAYENLLSEPEADENEEARTRAMELAQNRVLTSLISDLSTSDAHAVHTPLDDDTGTDQVSLITRYYAEAGR